MPGDAVVQFVADPQAERLVAAVAELGGRGPEPFVLVGGLAVAARLKTFHRATQDLDAVVAGEQRRFQQVTIEAITSARVDAGMLSVDGVVVDIIDIDSTIPIVSLAVAGVLGSGGFIAAAHAASSPPTYTSPCGSSVESGPSNGVVSQVDTGPTVGVIGSLGYLEGNATVGVLPSAEASGEAVNNTVYGGLTVGNNTVCAGSSYVDGGQPVIS